jgi:hypothetical protein
VMVAEFDRRRLYESWECRSAAQWLTWKCGIAPRTAREQVHVARMLERLPVATAAFGRGELSYAKVRAMARVVDVVPEDELMNLATAATAGQLERILGTFRRHHKRLSEPPARRQTFRAWWDDENETMLRLGGKLGADDAMVVLAGLATMRKRREAAESGSAEPFSEADRFDPEAQQRRSAEDLVDMARAAMGLGEEQGPPVEVVVHADLDVLLGLSESGRAWIDGGPPLPADVARRLGCDANWRLIVEDKARNPLYVGRRSKDPNTFQRAAVWSRSAGRCEVPHCEGRMRHMHHVWWWAKGGPTDIDHLLGVCRRCHTLIHKEQLTVTALGNQRFGFADGDGVPITANPTAPDLQGSTIEDSNNAAGVHCDSSTCASSGGNEPFSLRYVVDTMFDGLTYRQQQQAKRTA